MKEKVLASLLFSLLLTACNSGTTDDTTTVSDLDEPAVEVEQDLYTWSKGGVSFKMPEGYKAIESENAGQLLFITEGDETAIGKITFYAPENAKTAREAVENLEATYSEVTVNGQTFQKSVAFSDMVNQNTVIYGFELDGKVYSLASLEENDELIKEILSSIKF